MNGTSVDAGADRSGTPTARSQQIAPQATVETPSRRRPGRYRLIVVPDMAALAHDPTTRSRRIRREGA
jgi:hypothetical protein